MRVLIVGPQGAGKGTQATLLAQNLQVPHISTGDIFRANATAGTDLGALAKKYMDAGELVPDEVTSAMVKARLEESDVDGGFLLDGFPRTVPQAQWLGGVLHENEHDLDAVLLLDAPDDVLHGADAGPRAGGRHRGGDLPSAGAVPLRDQAVARLLREHPGCRQWGRRGRRGAGAGVGCPQGRGRQRSDSTA